MADIALSGAERLDISLYRGDTGRFRITVADTDVSEADWDADIRASADDDTVIGNFVITPVEGDENSVDVSITSELSEQLNSNCVYDIEMRLSGDVTTLVGGVITITRDVSRPE